jgi:hypothetical protein
VVLKARISTLTQGGREMREEESVIADFHRAQTETPSLRIACAGEADLPSIMKLGWLLGKSPQLLVPWPAEVRSYMDVEETLPCDGEPSDGDTLIIDRRLLEWRRTLLEHLREDAPVLLPAWIRRMTVYTDFGDNFGGGQHDGDSQQVLDGTVIASDGLGPPPAMSLLRVDLPALVIENYEVLRKVMRDYPTASASLRALVREAYQTICTKIHDGKHDPAPTTAIRTLLDEIVAPAVRRIKEERSDALKVAAVRAVTRLTTLGIPLLVVPPHPSTMRVILTALVSLGSAKVIGDEIVEGFASSLRLKKDPGFAALRLGFSACGS